MKRMDEGDKDLDEFFKPPKEIDKDLAIFLMQRLPEWTRESRIEFSQELIEEVKLLLDVPGEE